MGQPPPPRCKKCILTIPGGFFYMTDQLSAFMTFPTSISSPWRKTTKTAAALARLYHLFSGHQLLRCLFQAVAPAYQVGSRRGRVYDMHTPRTYHTVKQWYSPSGSFLQMEPPEGQIPCRGVLEIPVRYTTEANTNFKLYYQVCSSSTIRYAQNWTIIQMHGCVCMWIMSGGHCREQKEWNSWHCKQKDPGQPVVTKVSQTAKGLY